ncbi:MAG: hypothetical protein AB7S68_18605 [Polyangiaceae bacterium]
MRKSLSGIAGAAALSLLLVVACSGGDEGGGSAGGNAGVGEPCSGNECRRGLACSPGGVCQPAGDIAFGAACTISAECKDELQCVDSRCINAGSGLAGDACLADTDCSHGLRCAIVGFGAQCVPEGNTDLGGSCATPSSCFGGLTCVGGECQKPPAGGSSLGASEFPGVTCAPISAGTVRAFFEVPGVSDPAGQAGDFFRLPFPNDVLFDDGKLNLKGFPTPGSALLGYDPVKIYVDALTQSATGWGTYPAVIFRFSGHIDFESFQFVEGVKKPVQWVDITPGDDFGRTSGLRWVANEAGGKYICSDYFAIQRPQGSPMIPGHSYAVFLTTDGKDKSGNVIERSPQFEALLADSAPSDPVLAKAHAKFAGFRSYLADQTIDPATILNATVITAEDVRAPMRQVASAVAAAPVPSASGWVRCDTGVQSPCPDAEGDRGCQAEGADFTEYHALVDLPIFQAGDAPYLTSGGAIQSSVQRTESVCLSVTVPKGATMPAEGWPAVVFAHGTGGSFRSHVRDEVAGALAKASTPFVVLGIDQVEHGPRRGGSTESPNNLFFNFANPAAARGNPLQGAADQLSLGRFAAALDVNGADTGGEAIKVDPLRVVFFGHSQGATEGSLAIPYATDFRAAVLSGNGASLKDSLLTKTQPVNLKAAVPLVLGDFNADFELVSGTNHPVLTLLQQWVDPVDPLNFAGLWRTPEMDMLQKSVFQTYGLGDSYSTPVTLATYIQAGKFDLATADSSANPPDPLSGITEQSGAVSGNLGSGTETLTLGAREYGPPSGQDGHFVVFDVASANADMVRFLVAAAQNMTPSVGQ